jgi:hypothetical protein
MYLWPRPRAAMASRVDPMTETLTAVGAIGAGLGIVILLVMALVPLLLALPLPTSERRAAGIDSSRGWADPGQ